MIYVESHLKEKKDLEELLNKYKDLMNVKYKNAVNFTDQKDLYSNILN